MQKVHQAAPKADDILNERHPCFYLVQNKPERNLWWFQRSFDRMQIFLARQPIFDKNRNVFAYELLFRSGSENYYSHDDGDHATSKVLSNSFFSIGLESVTRGKKAFINFTTNLLLNEVATIFPPDQMAVEILEDVRPDAAVVAKCRELKELGYQIVLDDFVFRPELAELIELADIIKVDFIETTGYERRRVMRQVNRRDVSFLAEKVETHEDYKEAVKLGYEYFQGYFFAKPDIISSTDLPSCDLNYLRVLQHINKPTLDFDQLEKIFRQDVSLSYKLLRFINSAYFGLPNQIKSIRHALNMIGLKQARKWLSLIALSSLGKDKSDELVHMSLVRANLCERIAPLLNYEKEASELFMMGLFSLIDAFLDRPMEEILEKMPLSTDIKNALLGESSRYLPVYKLVLAYEKGEWNRVFEYLTELDSLKDELPTLFFETIEHSNLILSF